MKGCLQFFGGPSKCFWRNSGLQFLFWFLYVKYMHTDYTRIKRSWKCTCVSKQIIGGANCCTCTPARCIVMKYDCTCAAGRSNVARVSRSIMISIVALAKSEKILISPAMCGGVWSKPFCGIFCSFAAISASFFRSRDHSSSTEQLRSLIVYVVLLRSQLLFFVPEITAFSRKCNDITAVRRNCCDLSFFFSLPRSQQNHVLSKSR